MRKREQLEGELEAMRNQVTFRFFKTKTKRAIKGFGVEPLCARSTTIPSAVRTFGQRLLVLHCNYNGAVAPKFDLVITFDWRVLLT